MKFIKTIDGNYINPNRVERFSTGEDSFHKGAVWCRFSGCKAIIAKFDTYAEAQVYLDKLIAELNSDGQLKNQPLEDKIADARILLDSAYVEARALENDALRNDTLYYLDNALNAVDELLTFIN